MPIFDCLQRLGEIPEQEMFEIFNMGIGMVVAVAASQVDEVIEKIYGTSRENLMIGGAEHDQTDTADCA